ncbi:MAG: HEPN domain-containing protein [Nitrospiraceae bacterium]
MPPERRPPDDPIEWLNRAKSNLARAKADVTLPAIYLEDLCFDAQQAAEKAIKALLLSRNIAFPFVHDLAELVTVLQQSGQAVPTQIAEAARLTRFAGETRYPSLAEAVTREDYKRAVAIAEEVIVWVESKIHATE